MTDHRRTGERTDLHSDYRADPRVVQYKNAAIVVINTSLCTTKFKVIKLIPLLLIKGPSMYEHTIHALIHHSTNKM